MVTVPGNCLLRARLEERDGGLALALGGDAMALPESLLARRPGLRARAGSEVVVGIGPEDIEDAAFVLSANGSAPTPAGPTPRRAARRR